MDDIEPLETATWFGELEKLARPRATPTNAALARLLRRAFHLLQLTPRPLRGTIRSDLTEERLEALLAVDAFDSAAIGLVGQPIAFGIFTAEPGLFEAHIRLPNQLEPTSVRAPILAAAVLDAWLKSLIALKDRALTPRTENPHEAPRKARSGPRLRLIEH